MTSGAFTPRVKRAIRKRAGFQCEVCTTQLGPTGEHMAHIHHRRPRGMGGSTDPMTGHVTNGLLLCPTCHVKIESHRDWALDRGFLVHQGQNPATVPVRLWNSFDVYLLLDGTYGRVVEPQGGDAA